MNPGRRAGSVAITGASGALGQALALEYAAPQVTLHLCGRHSARLEDTAARCRERGADVRAAILDVTDNAAAEDWVRRAEAAAPLDLLVSNAGVNAGPDAPGLQETPQAVRRMFEVNFFGQLAVAGPALEAMLARGRGQVALLASLGAYRGVAGFPAYCASKAAIRAYAQGLRATLAPRGVLVSVISPGFVDTPMCAQLDGGKPLLVSPERAARIIRRGLEAGRGEIAFPALLALGLKLLPLLPEPLANLFLKGFRYRVAPRRAL